MTSFQAGHGLAFLTVLLSLSTKSIGKNQSEAQSPAPVSAIHLTQVLGFEGAKHSAPGGLKIQDGVMQFQHDGSTAAQVGISSIQDIFVEDGDKQLLNLNNGARLPEGKDEQQECLFVVMEK